MLKIKQPLFLNSWSLLKGITFEFSIKQSELLQVMLHQIYHLHMHDKNVGFSFCVHSWKYKISNYCCSDAGILKWFPEKENI